MTPLSPTSEYNGGSDTLQCNDAVRLLQSLGAPGARPAIRGLYLHIPFCFHKCHYCDFYSIVDDRDRQAAFTDRMIAEMAALAPLVEGRVETIFTGGGTPTLLRPELWRRLLDALHDHFDLSQLAEFTVEANPETVSAELLDVLRGGGVNRISIGCQSFDPQHLKTLERWHDPRNVEKAMELARAAGITNINLDLIFAIPGQTLADWQVDLERAISLRPAHLSCYSLMYEPHTALTKKMELGRLTPCDEDLEAAMYEHTIDRLAPGTPGGAGFVHYEISNWALPGRECRHNLMYWLNENWLAIGPSASGHVNGVRWKNVPHLGRYLAPSGGGGAAGGAAVQDVEQLDAAASIGEQLMLRLRLIEGVELSWLEPRLTDARRRAVNEQVAAGLVERTATHIRLTRRGLLLADDVVAELL